MFKGTPLLSQMICRKAPRRTGARGRAAKEKGRGRAHWGRLSFIEIFGRSWYSIEAIIGQLYLREGEREVHQELVQLPGDASL